jgi:hypothetical protein
MMNVQRFMDQTHSPEYVEEVDKEDEQNPEEVSDTEAENAPASTIDVQQTPAISASVPNFGATGETPNTGFPGFAPAESERFHTRWNDIQGKFVDEPRSAVEQADALVAEVVEKITRVFTDEHSTLKSQWRNGNNVSTEDLRQTLQRYRSLFNRLVV